MNGLFCGQKKILTRLWMGLFCMAFAVYSMLGMTDEEHEQPVLYIENTGDSWEICVSGGLLKLTRGEAMALLLEVDVPEGWKLSSVEQAEGAEGLTLTVDADEGVLTLLLDGYPKQDGEALITLRFRATAEEKPTISGKDGEVTLYCSGENGIIERIPLLILEEEKNTEKEDTTVSEDVSEGDMTEQQTVETSTSEPNISDESDSFFPDEPSKKSPLFGCQETTVEHGLYAVRFWIHGDDTAVICMEGGGVLQLEIVEDGEWRSVTFRGMRREGRYVFLVYGSEEIVNVIYEDGRFNGFEKSIVRNT